MSITPALASLTAAEATRVIAQTGVPVEHVYAGTRGVTTLVGVYTHSAAGADVAEHLDAVVAALEAVAGTDRLVRAAEHGWPRDDHGRNGTGGQ